MLTLDDMGGREGQGKTDRLTQHMGGGGGGNAKSERKVAKTLTLNVLLGMPQVPQRVPEVTSGISKVCLGRF